MTSPNLPHPHIKMEPRLQTTSGPALEITDDTISVAQRMMETETGPVTVKKETMENEVADNRGKGESPGFRVTHGPTLANSGGTIRSAHKMLGSTATPDEAKQDNVGNEVADNISKGETSSHDYDAFDEMSNEADKLQVPFADKDAMGGWKNVGQLPVLGDVTGGGDTWDPGPPTPFCFIQGLSHNFARYFVPECTVVSS